MKYEDVLELPLKVFTLYNTNITRIRAEEDMRILRIHTSSQSQDGVREICSKLEEELGTTMETEKDAFVPMEEGAIEKLKALANGTFGN